MYQVDILNSKTHDWEECFKTEDIKIIDKFFFKQVQNENKNYFRILENDCLLLWFDCSEHKYWYFKEKYVRDKGINYDYVKSYYNYQKRKELKKKKDGD